MMSPPTVQGLYYFKGLRFLLFLLSLLFVNSIYANSYAQGACKALPDSKTCIDTMPCKTDTSGVLVCLAGVSITGGASESALKSQVAININESCWQYSFDYICTPIIETQLVGGNSLGPNVEQLSNGCLVEQSNPACSLVDSLCSSQINSQTDSSQCVQYQQTYSCVDQIKSTNGSSSQNQPSVCQSPVITSTALSLGVNNLDPKYQNPTTSPVSAFAQAAIAMEVASEMQTYSGCRSNDSKSCSPQLLFPGVRESCTKGWLGVKNCCKAQPGAKTNAAMLGILLGPSASVVKYVGESAVDSASPYVFDAMYSSGAYTQGMSNAINQSANVIVDSQGFAQTTIFSSSGISASAYGFEWGLGSAPNTSGLFGATSELGSFSSSFGDYYVSFNPYVFVASAALSVIESMGQCSASENLLAMHRGENLSVYVSEVCNESIALTNQCVSYQDNYCSFNGVLGKIINQQGKAQLGMDGSNCSGLTEQQIASIDFSKINFSEFTGKLLQQAQNNLPKNISENYLPIQKILIKGSQQSVVNSLSYPTNPTLSPP